MVINIKTDNREYWAQRAASYSDVSKWELEGESRAKWKKVLQGQISSHYPERSPEEIKILDVGTGPGFFAIILTELGYKVTAVDMSCEMLEEARQNAGALSGSIDYMIMDAEALELMDETFDAVVSRNLTWNLPDPDIAYREWTRVLRTGGLLLNFDANWYGYLFDEEAARAYEADRAKSEELGLGDQNVGENFDLMEDIARVMPMSGTIRPEWDIETLSALGMQVSADQDIWREVWTGQEQINFASTPMFLVRAVK